MRAALLLADPDSDHPGYLERNLRSDGFDVVEAGWASQALDIAERSRPDIVLVGEAELCARLREGEPGRRWDRNIPVIVLTAAGADPVDRVRAFERGADDVAERGMYPELVARIHAVLRRSAVGQADVLEVGELVIDRRARQVRVGGVSVSLAGREFDLAFGLASDPYRVFTKEELLRDVWGYGGRLVTRTVDSHASRLRRKLRAAGAELPYVINVWGRGYRLLE
ncbi:MAG: response regulator transcription factor [Thermoleophilia bacterium]|nr:response regulator transcription factor [Thermoleophilia bacterium]